MPTDAEIELTFETGPGFALPDLTDVPGVAAVAVPEERLLEATYYDTADLRLAARRLTLRRRTGGHDAGWHLKRPRADGYRDELQQPLRRRRGARRVHPAGPRARSRAAARSRRPDLDPAPGDQCSWTPTVTSCSRSRRTT